jgi:parvulin-like peptidyl-prolyl isomerase
MTSSSNNPQHEKQDLSKSKRKADKQARRAQAQAVATRRRLSKKQRETQQQRRALIVVGSVLAVALVVFVGGILYDTFWLPSRPVAQVGNTTLTRDDYWEERRSSIAQQIVQNFRFLRLFGSDQQFSAQFAGQSPTLNQEVDQLPSLPINEQVVTAWQDRQLLEIGADILGIEVSSTEVEQELVQDLGGTFAPPALDTPAPITGTDTLTGTDTVTGTDTLTGTDTVTGTDAAPPAPPTPTTVPTVAPAEATERTAAVIDAIYSQYTGELELAAVEPALTRADFRAALEQGYRNQLLRSKIQEQLLPEGEFTPDSQPEQVAARQIFLRVELPEDASDEAIEAAYAERLDEAQNLAEQLRGGADFAELAAEFSDDPGSRDQGGDVGRFGPEGQANSGATYPPAFVEAAYNLAEGEISEPIRTEFGWHIIEVTERVIPTDDEQLGAARSEALEEYLNELREDHTVERFTEATAAPVPEDIEMPTPVPTYLPGPPTPLPTPTLMPATPMPEFEDVQPTVPQQAPTAPQQAP